MNKLEDKAKTAILRLLREHSGPVSSSRVSSLLQAREIDLSPRTVRLYMEHLEQAGFLAPARRGRSGGRMITEQGLAELEKRGVVERLGFIGARMDRLAFEMTYHPRFTPEGTVIMNLTLVDEAEAVHATREMMPVFQAGLGMGEYVGLFPSGAKTDSGPVPAGKFAIGTVCSVTLNGILLKEGIPIVSDFGAVLEFRNGQPCRFTDLIVYSGTSLDPLEVFIKARLTRAHQAAITGDGRIGVSFRQFPAAALERVVESRRLVRDAGLDGIIRIGNNGCPLLEFPVHNDRIAMLVAGGLNPAAAIEEAGISIRSRALATLYPAGELIHYRKMQKRASAMLIKNRST